MLRRIFWSLMEELYLEKCDYLSQAFNHDNLQWNKISSIPGKCQRNLSEMDPTYECVYEIDTLGSCYYSRTFDRYTENSALFYNWFSSFFSSSCFTDTIYVQNHNLSSNDQEREDAQPYDSCHVDQLKDFKLITKVEEALAIDLNNLGEYPSWNGIIGKLKLGITQPHIRVLNLVIIDAQMVLFKAWDFQYDAHIWTN